MANLMTGAEIVFKVLEDQNVRHIFGYPGGAVLPIYDELKNHKKIKHILVRHEQGAGHAQKATQDLLENLACYLLLLDLGPQMQSQL